eukprot:CAMPEP_0116905998 /NCGR_PEP_ID=MMETSP0467-20121206/12282_1 /TAXON_ID=283647 /ORGANISM="Mesodinium pulex, Strain SPMC105" /LENGTH=130 /DNA_ID=CAMNT_0004580809 /DNA_START=1403 /DNA_END=1793 /DNA_ORIENTATION=+
MSSHSSTPNSLTSPGSNWTNKGRSSKLYAQPEKPQQVGISSGQTETAAELGAETDVGQTHLGPEFLEVTAKVNLDNQAEVTSLLNTILNDYGSSVHNLDLDLREWFDKTLDSKTNSTSTDSSRKSSPERD